MRTYNARRWVGTAGSGRLDGVVFCVVTLIAMWSWGCHDKKTHDGDFSLGDADILQSGPLSLDESSITASIDGTDMVSEFQVTVQEPGALPLTGSCSLVDAQTGQRRDSVPARFEQTGTTMTGTCRFPLETAWPEDADPAAQIQVIEVTGADGASKLLSHTALTNYLHQTVVEVFGPDSFDSSGKGVVRVLAHDMVSGKPASGVPIRVELSQGSQGWTAATGTTDEQGQLLLEYPVEADNLDGILMKVVANIQAHDISSPTVLLDHKPFGPHLLLTTDKPIYQPEQNIYMRVLALEGPKRLPMANEPTVFSVYDSKERKVAKFTTQTNEFGIAAATMKLGRVIDLGTYRIEAELGGQVAKKTVTLSRYALPRFRIDIQTDKPYYKPSEWVQGTVSTEYFFGQKVVNATVQVRAFTYIGGFTLFTEVTSFTDEQGQATFSVQLPDRFYGTEFLQGNALLLLEATVTDSAGHEETSTKSLVVSPSNVLTFVVPDNARLAPGRKNRFFVETVTPAGSPISCRVTLSAGGQPVATVDTNENGIAAASFDVQNTSLALQVRTVCADGAPVLTDVRFDGSADPATEGLLVLADKPTAAPGESVDITILAPKNQDIVSLDVVRNGLPMVTDMVEIEDGQGSYHLEISPDMAGLCELRAYAIGQSGVLIRNTRLLYVRPENSLSVAMTTDKDQYRPGDMARLQLQVTDGSGRGTAAAVGLSVVDEAVFAISDFRPGVEKVFYDFEDRLREPSYQVKNCSFEDVEKATNDPGKQEKAALFLAALNEADTFYAVHWTLADIPRDDARKTQGFIIAADAENLGDWLSGKVDSIAETASLLSTLSLFDPWGQAYTATATDHKVCLASLGPDETPGTNDDFTHICRKVRYKSDHVEYFDAGSWADGSAPPWDGGPSTDGGPGPDGGMVASPRLRKDFPETLYFHPAVITDNDGHATVDIPLADSITTWKVAAIANAASGGLGSADHGILVFQPFFLDPDLPAYLLDSVEVTIPVIVSNYSSQPQDVTVTLRQDSWFTLLDESTKSITVPPQTQAAVSYQLRVLHVGHHSIHVEGTSEDFADAVEKPILVRPNGKEYATTCGGMLDPGQTASCQVTYPATRVDGADELLVKVYSEPIAHVIEGLDSMIKEPFG